MKLNITLILSLLITATTVATAQSTPQPAPTQAKLPSVQEILDKHTKAVGGRDAIQKRKTLQTKGTVELAPMGVKGTFEITAAPPDRVLTKMDLAGIGEFLDGYDGKIAWASNPLQGMREKTGVELLQTKLSSNFYRDVSLDKIYARLAVKGIEKVAGKDAYVVTGQAEGLPETTFYFDAASGLLVRTDSTVVSPEGRQPVKVFIEEMRSVDGVMMPWRIKTILPVGELTMTATEAKTGVPVTDATFAKPKS